MPDPLGLALLTAIGVCVGIIGASVGVGGGFFVAPFLLLGAGFEPARASATSLAVVWLTAVSSVLAYEQRREVEHRIAVPFALASLPGAVAGTFVVGRLSPGEHRLVFAGLLAAAAVLLWTPLGERRAAWPVQRIVLVGTPVAAVVAVVGALFGVGGGVLLVPLMVLAFGMRIRAAAATAQFALVATATAGVVAYALQGWIEPSYAVPVGLGAVLGAQAGARGSAHARRGVLRGVLGAVLLLAAALLLLR
jgi:uncharacterized membrane protein YfcA